MTDRFEYDEFGLFHENAAEYGLPYHRPPTVRRVFAEVAPGRRLSALAWQDKLVRLHKALFLDASPSPTKFALAQLGLCSDETRLPIAPCADAVKPAVLAAMREAGLEPTCRS